MRNDQPFLTINYNTDEFIDPIYGDTYHDDGSSLFTSPKSGLSYTKQRNYNGISATGYVSYKIALTQVPVYTVTVSASPSFGGSVSGGGTFEIGSVVTVVASPSANYIFVNWTESGIPVSTNPSYTFTLTSDVTLLANFAIVFQPISSAGVFNSNGTLVRTLWSVQHLNPILNNFQPSNLTNAWDGTLDDGSVAPTGTYTLGVIHHNTNYAWDGVVGNSSPDHLNATRYWNPSSIIPGMCFNSTTGFASGGYTEKWQTIMHFALNDIQHVDSWNTFLETLDLATDGTTLFSAAVDVNAPGPSQNYMIGFTIATGNQVSFSGNPNFGVSGDFINGLAVDSSFVYAARSTYVATYNKTTGALVTSFTPAFTPFKLALNPSTGDLWISSTTTTVTKCTVSGGTITATGTQVTGLQAVRSIAISPDGSTLLVADGGSSQQVKAFNTSDGSVKTAFGTSGAFGVLGGYANSPTVTDNKFMFWANVGTGAWGPQGCVAYGVDGSFWLVDGGNCRVLHFSAGNSPTIIERIAYIPTLYTSGPLNRTDPTRLMVGYIEFAIDYTKPLSPTNGSWRLVNNWTQFFTSMGSQPDNYRTFLGWSTLSNGRTYGRVGASLYELTATGARDMGLGANFNNYMMDPQWNLYNFPTTSGGVSATFKINPIIGFDGSNNPLWAHPVTSTASWDTYVTTEVLPSNFPPTVTGGGPFDFVDKLANGSFPVYDRDGTLGVPHLGGINVNTGKMQFLTAPSTTSTASNNYGITDYYRWPPPPYFLSGQGNFNAGGPICWVPGAIDFFTQYKGEQWGGGQVDMWTHWHDSGLAIGQFGASEGIFINLAVTDAYLLSPFTLYTEGRPYPVLPGSKPAGTKGLAAAAGNADGVGIGLVNGNYYIYTSDEWYHAGCHRFTISNLASIQNYQQAVNWDSSSYVAPTADPYDLLSTLPYSTSNMTSGAGGWVRNPTTDSGSRGGSRPWIEVGTSLQNYQIWPRQSPDLFSLCALGGTGTATVTKTIPRSHSGNWVLSGTLIFGYDFGFSQGSDPIQLYIDVLDNTSKIIARLYNGALTFGANPSMYVNGIAITTPFTDYVAWGTYIGNARNFTISGDIASGKVSFTYGDFGLANLAVNDVGANVASPAMFRLLHTQTGPGPFPQTDWSGVDITKLYFSE